MDMNFYLVIITIILIGLGGIVYRIEALLRQINGSLEKIAQKTDKN
jgi:hypothetical protein